MSETVVKDKGMKKKSSKKKLKKLNSSKQGGVAYLLKINEEPQEAAIGLTQEEFDFILDFGSASTTMLSVYNNPKSFSENLVDFATVEPVRGKKFLYKGEVIKRKKLESLFGAAMNIMISDYLEIAKNKNREEVSQNLEKNSPSEAKENSTDPLVEEVAQALMNSWFPMGHVGEREEALREDRAEWTENAYKDAEIAVSVMRKYL